MNRSLLALFLTLSSCGGAAAHETAPSAESRAPNVDYAALVAAPDRTEKDRSLDAGRHPVETLRFLDVRRGLRVADLGAGPGYTSELLRRAVGDEGVVYLQNEPTWIPFLKEPLEARLARPAMKGVVRVDRPFQEPLPPEAKELDLVVMNLIYHDVVNTKTDRTAMNAAIFKALRSGGAYVVIDTSAPSGSGVRDTEALHRIDEEVAKREVVSVGFRLASEGDFLRNPSDARDWDASPKAAEKAGRRGTSDRFALRFEKP